jgi:branched-chain amino acid transport system permease protein
VYGTSKAVAEGAEPSPAPAASKVSATSVTAVVIVLALVPLVWSDDHVTSLLVLTLLYALMAQSLDLLMGLCGIWNLGQLAIVAIGGYTAGILVAELGISAWLALPAGVLAGGVAALIVVAPVMRVSGVVAAALTFVVAQAVRLLITADPGGLTGGRSGLSGVSGLFDGLSFTWNLRAYYWLALALSVGVMLLVARTGPAPAGAGLLRPPEPARTSAGSYVARHRPLAIVVFSGLIAGVAGGLYVTFFHGMTPDFIAFRPLGLLLVIVVVGGLGSVRGPLLGAFVVTLTYEVLRGAPILWLAVEGGLLFVVLVFWPGGIDGLLQRGIDAIRRR